MSVTGYRSEPYVEVLYEPFLPYVVEVKDMWGEWVFSSAHSRYSAAVVAADYRAAVWEFVRVVKRAESDFKG